MITKWAVGQNYYKVKNYLLKNNYRLVDNLMNNTKTLGIVYFNNGVTQVIITTKIFSKDTKLQCGEVLKIKITDYD